jgi:hypothetical protein
MTTDLTAQPHHLIMEILHHCGMPSRTRAFFAAPFPVLRPLLGERDSAAAPPVRPLLGDRVSEAHMVLCSDTATLPCGESKSPPTAGSPGARW